LADGGWLFSIFNFLFSEPPPKAGEMVEPFAKRLILEMAQMKPEN
jgi:hypothetical protein